MSAYCLYGAFTIITIQLLRQIRTVSMVQRAATQHGCTSTPPYRPPSWSSYWKESTSQFRRALLPPLPSASAPWERSGGGARATRCSRFSTWQPAPPSACQSTGGPADLTRQVEHVSAVSADNLQPGSVLRRCLVTQPSSIVKEAYVFLAGSRSSVWGWRWRRRRRQQNWQQRAPAAGETRLEDASPCGRSQFCCRTRLRAGPAASICTKQTSGLEILWKATRSAFTCQSDVLGCPQTEQL